MPAADRPIRVLHLLGRPPDYQTDRAVEPLCRADALAKGPGRAVAVERADVGSGGRWRNRLAAVVGLRRLAGDLDLVHCWDEPALTVAAFAGARRILYSPQAAPTAAGVRWVRAVMGYRDVRVVCPSAVARRQWVGRGVPPDRCHLVRPGVDFARVRRPPAADVSALRAALGLRPADFVLLVPGESTDAADHFRAVWAASILHVLDPAYRCLLWGRGPRAGYVLAEARKLGQGLLVVAAEERLGRRVDFDALLPAADAALVTASGPMAVLPVAAGMAAELPILSFTTAATAELLEDRHTALMVRDPKPRLLAERVLALRDDPAVGRKIADAARAEAYAQWPLSAFMDRWRSVYAQAAAGGPVVLPDLTQP